MSELCLSIAVVDDEPSVRRALRRLLQALGFVVGTFASGEEFLETFGSRRLDCVILDLHLPGLSGLEVQQELSRRNIPTPCIVITGKDEPGTSDRVLACGAAAYLKKPVDEQVLLSAICAAVPHRADLKQLGVKRFETETEDIVNQTPIQGNDT